MEPELSDIFWVKMVAKNIVLGSPETHPILYIWGLSDSEDSTENEDKDESPNVALLKFIENNRVCKNMVNYISIFANSSILDVLHVSHYASGIYAFGIYLQFYQILQDNFQQQFFGRCAISAKNVFLDAQLQNSLWAIQNQSPLLGWGYIPAKVNFLKSVFLCVKNIVEKRFMIFAKIFRYSYWKCFISSSYYLALIF